MTEEKEVRSKLRWPDILLVVASGALTALSFPKFNLSFLAWISLIPLLFALLNKSPRQSFLLGLIGGISFNAILIDWIPDVPSHYGNLSVGMSFLIFLVFVLYLALYWALFAWLFARVHRTYPRLIFLMVPFIWVSLEYILSHLLTGFPWGLLGYTQYRNLWFLQLTSLLGIYGISFMLVLFQSMFVISMVSRRRTPFFLALMLMIIVHLAGWSVMHPSPETRESFEAAVIQGNVSSDIDWSRIPDRQEWDLFESHMTLSSEAYHSGASLIVWPEFTVPLCFSCPFGIYPEFKARLIQFVRESRCTLLLGTSETTFSEGDVRYLNTALCLHPDLSISEYYKMHLVPFGEYIPYKKVFFFIEKLTQAIGEISPGKKFVLHQFEGNKFGSPICFEIIFPDLVRKFVKKGADFLVTITNDGWYGNSSAPYQHFAIAVVRAVENRRFLLRAATTGISGIIDPYGRILSRSEMMTQTFLTAAISPMEILTPYTRWGDFFSLACLTLSAIFLILALVLKKNGRKKQGIEGKRL
jgi:apolipoprotein N-acyltransferase